MNIKGHIDAGHYPKDEKGRSYVPTRYGATFVCCATDKPGERPIVGWIGPILDCQPVDTSYFLPPTPRKVQVVRWAVFCADGAYWSSYDSYDMANRIAGNIPGRRVVKLTGVDEIPFPT